MTALRLSKNAQGSAPVIAARLDDVTYARLQALAAEQRRPLGSLVRIILEDFVKASATPADSHTERAAD